MLGKFLPDFSNVWKNIRQFFQCLEKHSKLRPSRFQGLGNLSGERKLNGEGDFQVRGADHRNGCAVRLDEALNDGEAEPCAAQFAGAGPSGLYRPI